MAWANLVEAQVTKLLDLHNYNPSDVCVIISVPIAEDAPEAVLLRWKELFILYSRIYGHTFG